MEGGHHRAPQALDDPGDEALVQGADDLRVSLGQFAEGAVGEGDGRLVVVAGHRRVEAEGVPNLALRVAVRPGGCSGFSYEMFFDTDVSDDDKTAEFSGVKVVVDPSSAMLLEGATLDYKDGLQGAGFAIDNPNAQRTCGCGQSFS